MGAFIANRLDDMLRIYGNNAVADARAEAEKVCETLTDYNEQLARHSGECRAWVEHDAHFIWERRLSNPYNELREFVIREAQLSAGSVIYDWQSLRDRSVMFATSLLARMQYPAIPALLPTDRENLYWQLVAIVHECDAQIGK